MSMKLEARPALPWPKRRLPGMTFNLADMAFCSVLEVSKPANEGTGTVVDS